MAEPKTEQEPSIEEILESIRQIISDDGDATPASGKGPDLSAVPDKKDAPSSLVLKGQPQAVDQDSDIVLDLTDVVPADSVSTLDLSVAEENTDDEQETVLMANEPDVDFDGADLSRTSADAGEGIVSEVTASAASAAMAKLLATNVFVERDEPSRMGSVTLEDIARELMRPVIKTWLDQNLPRIIEKMVAKEIERLSRRAMDK